MAYALELHGIVKRFPGVLANDHIDLAVKSGEILALVGENGAGKTTLMRVLYGLYTPDAGTIAIYGQPQTFHSPHDAICAGLGMVHQHFMLFPSLSVSENVMYGAEPTRFGFIDRRKAAQEIEALAKQYGLDVEPDAKVGRLPVGIRQRVEILKILYRQADIVILDEPTAVLTPPEQESLFTILQGLAKQGKTIIFITHKLHEVMKISDHITVLRNGKVTGNLKTAETTPEEICRFMIGRDAIFHIEKSWLFDSSRDGFEMLKGTLAATRHENTQKIGQDAVSIARYFCTLLCLFVAIIIRITGTIREPKSSQQLGEPILQVEHLSIKNETGRRVVNDVSFTVQAGEIVGIAGVAGNGQNDLIEAITGLRTVKEGQIFLTEQDITNQPISSRRKNGQAYIPEDRGKVGLALQANVSDNLIMASQRRPGFSRKGVLLCKYIRSYVTRLIVKYAIKVTTPNESASNLSGGNLQKVVIAREFSRRGRVLIAEQPTRGLDIGSIEFIHRQLIDYRNGGNGILLVSAELSEIMDLSDRILVMFRGQIVGKLPAAQATEETLGLLMAGGSLDKNETEYIQ